MGNYGKFQAMARGHSKCLSGKSAVGSLGMFKPGMMVSAFNKAIFGKENNVGEAIGPIQMVSLQFIMMYIHVSINNIIDICQ